MKKLTLSLLLAVSLFAGQTAFSQSISNTGNTITVDNTCINNRVVSGTYTLNLYYYDPDQNATVSLPTVSCSVTSNNTDHLVITVANNIFPTADANGYWSLADAWPAHLILTTGNNSFHLIWYMNEDGSLGFNCDPLGFSISCL